MPDIELTSAELDELERLAKAAGGREWYTDPTPTKEGLAIVDDGASMWPIKCEWPQARFVASANPATILALLSLARAGLEAGKAEESMAARDVLAERRRQIDAEGWTPEHDDEHSNGELANAAGIYALAAGSNDYRWVLRCIPSNDYLEAAMKLWPWDKSWFKPTGRRRDLVKAGALILAEIERLDRTAIRALPLTGASHDQARD